MPVASRLLRTAAPLRGGAFQRVRAGFGGECGFAGEMAVEGAMRQTGGAGDFRHAHGGNAVAPEQRAGVAQDGGAMGGLGGWGDAHGYMMVIMKRQGKQKLPPRMLRFSLKRDGFW